jgi:hypothetical protein
MFTVLNNYKTIYYSLETTMWWSFLLVEETRVPRGNQQLVKDSQQ